MGIPRSAWRVVVALAMLGVIGWHVARSTGIEAPLVLIVALASFVAWPRAAPLAISAWVRPATAYAAVIAIAWAAFAPAMRAGEIGNVGDWPVNEAIVRELYDAYAQGRAASWLAGTTVGDPTSDLYPTSIHTVLALIALAMGSAEHVHGLLVATTFVAYTLGAIAVARLALRGSTWPAAVLLGACTLLDAGSELFTWGTLTTWYWGLFPSTISIAVSVFGIPDLVDLEARRTRGRIARVWILYALAPALHPIGLIATGAWMASFALRAAFGDPRARAARAAVVLHLGIATALSAFVWLSSATRILQYGLHFGTPQVPLSIVLERITTGDLPDTSFPLLVVLGWLGGLLAWRARRSPAFVLFLGGAALVALYADPVFLELGLAPSPTTVRLQSFRIGTIAAPIVYAAAAFAIAPGRWIGPGAPGRERTMRLALSGAAAIACVIAVALHARSIVPAWRANSTVILALARHERSIDRDDFRELARHLEAEREAMPEGLFARAIYTNESRHPHHLLMLWDLAGVPVASRNECNACYFLREQLYDLSPENLDRYAVRWAIAIDRSPSVGAASTERRFGRYRVREIPSWTGALARVVRGSGRARLERFSPHEIRLALDGTEPALVEVGVPYYPRWRALGGGSSDEVPLYAASGPPGEREERVLALWMRPGASVVLRPNGTLPADRAGLPVTVMGIVLGALAWPRDHRRAAALRAWIDRAMRGWPWRAIALAGAALAVVVLLVQQGALGGVARALRVGVFFPRAQVSLVQGDDRVACREEELGRAFVCPDGTRVFGEMTHLVREVGMGWSVPSPGLGIEPAGHAEIELRTPLRLEGTYYAVCGPRCDATLRAGDATHPFDGETTRLEIAPAGGGAVLRVRASGRSAVAIIRESAIDVDRTRDVPWPPETPP